jgi:hypothetical protein
MARLFSSAVPKVFMSARIQLGCLARIFSVLGPTAISTALAVAGLPLLISSTAVLLLAGRVRRAVAPPGFDVDMVMRDLHGKAMKFR